ncbi:MAG TPA: outer membrane protein assembly factor BamE [Stellaceae bacterium]|nr:outer membrane protein assembly factor BamE [Stellaceae bacterium]
MLAASGCAATVDQRGALPAPERFAEIHLGLTKEQVVKILGTPSSMGVFDDNAWYYISRKTSRVSFFQPEVLDQNVFVINFDNSGAVRGLGHRTLADAQEIEPAPGATPAPGRELTFLEQIIGNVGRFNKGTGGSAGSGAGDTAEGRQAGPLPNDPNRSSN